MSLPMNLFGGRREKQIILLASGGEHLFVRHIFFASSLNFSHKNLRMWIEVFGLSCLLSILEAQKLPTTPTFNPECGGMRRAAKHLKNGIQLYLKKTSNCQPNPHCTGVKCTWSGGGYLEIDLHHCTNPVNYHVLLKAPDQNIFKNITLQKGDERDLYETFKLHVTELSRQGNIVTTTVELEMCSKLFGCRNVYKLVDQKFCVRMQNCPGYNASTAHYKPCYNPTGPPIDHSTKHTFRSTPSGPPIDHSTKHTFRSTPSGPPIDHSTKHTFRSTPSGHSSAQSSSLGTSSTAEPMPDRSSTDYPPTGSIAAQKEKRHKDDSHELSTAAIIGICAAAMFAILIVLAAGVYWKKYHHRSRLRAAYYNDISMHDPLYEDFGPEVA